MGDGVITTIPGRYAAVTRTERKGGVAKQNTAA